VIVSDILMPRMDGYRHCNEVRNIEQTGDARLKTAQPEIKVLFKSAYDAVVLHDLVDSGAAFLQKPFGPDAMLCKVSEVLNSGP
jgi:CheY-like chemotaxis protein